MSINQNYIRTASLILLLTLFWLANSGQHSMLIYVLGGISIVSVTIISFRLGLIDAEAQPVRLLQGIPFYFIWLSKQIVLSNIDVTRRIWQGNSAIDPQFARLAISQKTEIGRVILANSITLTPGTVSVDLDDSSILVHSISRQAITELETGIMDRRVSTLEDQCLR